MNTTLLKYDLFLKTINVKPTNESFEAETLVLESRTEGVRLIDYLQDSNTNEKIELDLLTETEKWDFENKLWEGVHFYATNDTQLFEGFWKNVIGGIRNLSDKALNVAKSMLTNIGKVIKACAQYCMKFLEVVKTKATEAGKAVWGAIKGPVDKKFADKMGQYTMEEIEKETGEWQQTVDWLSGKGPDTVLAKGVGDAGQIEQEIEKSSKEEKVEMLKAIVNKQKNAKNPNANKPAVKESIDEFYNFSVTRVINEIRSDKNYDMEELVEYSMMRYELENFYKSELGLTEQDELKIEQIQSLMTNEGMFDKLTNFVTGKGWTDDAEKKAEERTEKRIEKAESKPVATDSGGLKAKLMSKWENFKKGGGLSKIIGIITSGVVYLFEKLADYLFKGLAKSCSSLIKKFGGPGVFTFAVTVGVIVTVIALIAEFGMNTLTKFTGVEAFEKIGHTLHHYNPSYWVEQGVNLVLPGLGTALGVIAKMTCIGMALQHVIHLYQHNRDEVDHKKAKDLEKKEINKIKYELENKSVNDEQKEALTELIAFRTASIALHARMKEHEHDIHHIHEEISAIKKKLSDLGNTNFATDRDEMKGLEKELEEKKKELKSAEWKRELNLERIRDRRDEFKKIRQKIKDAEK